MNNIAVTVALSVAFAVGGANADQLDLSLMTGADVVFLGEVHDNPAHHANQAKAAQALAPAAIVFEMLTPSQAAKITPDLLISEAALGEALGWADSGWPDFSMYYPIFAAATSAQFFGAQMPREEVQAVLQGEDVATALDGAAADFGLTEPLPDAQQQEREAMQMAAHCDALPEEMLPIMVMAQRLRDARLAQAATEALQATGGPVVVITGNGHARTDWGAPALMNENVSVVALGQLEQQPEDAQPYDHWVVTAPAERDDPCAAFK